MLSLYFYLCHKHNQSSITLPPPFQSHGHVFSRVDGLENERTPLGRDSVVSSIENRPRRHAATIDGMWNDHKRRMSKSDPYCTNHVFRVIANATHDMDRAKRAVTAHPCLTR